MANQLEHVAATTILYLPALAVDRGLQSADFVVKEVLPGGMGVCFKIEHTQTRQLFAVKAQASASVADRSARARFIDEMKIWITLSSNGGIVPAYCIERINEV